MEVETQWKTVLPGDSPSPLYRGLRPREKWVVSLNDYNNYVSAEMPMTTSAAGLILQRRVTMLFLLSQGSAVQL